jgi:uncharacterized membrane protein YfcA
LSSNLELSVLAIAGFAAGFINAAAGAGSLLTLPALIFTGLDANAANATNRIAVLFQSAAAALTFHHKGQRMSRPFWWMALPPMMTAGAGAYCATLVTPEFMQGTIAVAMFVFLALSLLPKPERKNATDKAEVSFRPSMVLGVSAIGFYAGFLQAGVGVLMLLYFGWVYGIELVRANLIKVVHIGALTIVALIIFFVDETGVDLQRGLVLAASTSIGAVVGAHEAVKRGEGYIRVILVLAVSVSAIKLLWDLVYA